MMATLEFFRPARWLIAAGALLVGSAAQAQHAGHAAASATAAAAPSSAAGAMAVAPVTVQAAWARASVQGQQASGVFMRLTAAEPLRLVRAHSPVAGVAEVHEMKMDGDIMRMRAVDALPLPAGQSVDLRPGGYHLMLMELKTQLVKGGTVPLTLVFENAEGTASQLLLQVPVATSAPAGGHAHGGAHKH